MKYEVYYLEGLEDKTIWNKLTGMLFAFSDTFSLITFKYHQNEKASPTTTKILKEVSRYRIGSRIVKKWPSTEILGDQKHIYRMNLFRIDLNGIDKLFSVFEQVGTLWDWDYPDYPMDPCFYKNGYAWFSVSTHEHECQVFLE